MLNYKLKTSLNSDIKSRDPYTTPRNLSAPKLKEWYSSQSDSKRKKSERKKTPKHSPLNFTCKEISLSPKGREHELFIVDSIPFPSKQFEKASYKTERRYADNSDRAYWSSESSDVEGKDKDNGKLYYETIIKKLNQELNEAKNQLKIERETIQRIERNRIRDLKTKQKLESELEELEKIFIEERKQIKTKGNEEENSQVKKENEMLKKEIENLKNQNCQLIELLKDKDEYIKQNEKKLGGTNINETSELKIQLGELEKSFANLTLLSDLYGGKLAENEKTIQNLRTILAEKDQTIKFLEENASLNGFKVELDERNCMYTSLEKDLIARVKEYKDKTLNVLNSGEKAKRRPENHSPDFDQSIDSIKNDGKLGTQSNLSKSTSDLIDFIDPLLSPIQSVSPIRAERVSDVHLPKLQLNTLNGQDPYTPPTFRNPEANNSLQASLENSFSDIKKRLSYLQANTAYLDHRMDIFEQKVKANSDII